MTDKVFNYESINPRQVADAKCEHCGLIPERNIWACIIQKGKNDFDFELVRGDRLAHAVVALGFDCCFVQRLDLPRDCNAFFTQFDSAKDGNRQPYKGMLTAIPAKFKPDGSIARMGKAYRGETMIWVRHHGWKGYDVDEFFDPAIHRDFTKLTEKKRIRG